MSEMTLGLSGDETETPKTETYDLNLGELWGTYRSGHSQFDSLGEKLRGFRGYLRELAATPEDIDEVVLCARCEDPCWLGETEPLRGHGDTRVCEDCTRCYTACDNCDNLYPDDEVTTTLSRSQVCEGCLGNDYSYCEECAGWYQEDNTGDHDHDDEDDNCYCTPPAPDFTVRNDGCPPLASGTRVTITLPRGQISPEGLTAIRDYLRVEAAITGSNPLHALAYDLDALGSEWQDTRGNYAKRLSARAYKEYWGLKLDQAVLSQVGVLARDHSNTVSTVIEVTRDLNMSAADFYHDGSCWWTDYSRSRCALKTNGGFGIRSFDRYGRVSGRAWVLPLKLNSRDSALTPTFDTGTPAAFMAFNGYGELNGYTAPRIIAHMYGWTYRKTSFRCSPMYVNSGSGYLVGPEDVVREFTGNVYLGLEDHARLFDDEQAEKTAEKIKAEGASLHLPAEKETADVR